MYFVYLDETIRELRRTVMLELLTLQTRGVKDETSRHAIQKKTIDRLQQDEVHLTESRQKVSNLENEVNVLKRQLVDYRMSCDAEKLLLRQQLDEMDFNNTELKERVKIVDADSKLLKIVMIGKDAIVEKQVSVHTVIIPILDL
jgi:transposase-like protein